MKLNFKSVVSLSLFLAVAMVGRAQSVKPDERGLWNVWCVGTNSAFEASAVAVACQEFKAAAPKDPLAVVVAGFEAWNYLKRGNPGAAVPLFNSMLVVKEPATSLQKAADKMARSWLTRIDREQVVRGLKEIYVRDIEFPASLEALKTLKSAAAIPVSDRWGKPWEYRLASSIKGMAAQRYVLESSVLGAHSTLEKVLALPYAGGLQLQPVRVVAGVMDTVEFKAADGQSVFRQLGSDSSRISLAYLGANIVVLTDGNHWSVVPRPR